MTQAQTYSSTPEPTDFNRLPSRERAAAAMRKYAEAVEMFAATDMTIRSVAEKCGVTPYGLSAHISKHHRRLLLERHGIELADGNIPSMKIRPPRGQSLKTHLKYKDAIEACGDTAYIEFNISQIARIFNLSATGLTAQLRAHYPNIIPLREDLRSRLGLADNVHRGPRHPSKATYARAVEMYRDTELTLPEVAERCGVSKSGLCQFLRFYHQDVIASKAARRKEARRKCGQREPGERGGNGTPYGPKAGTVALYAPAMELYRNSPLTIAETAKTAGVPVAGFRGYLHQWGSADKVHRRGVNPASAKYAPAIASLRENPRDVAKVAAEFGLDPDVFREYLKVHEPELAARHGMTHRENGRRVRRSATEKYEQAIREYASSDESLRSIARRHGLVYNSILGYVARNCPEERERHRILVEQGNYACTCQETTAQPS